jgi:hypothetical protein
MAAVAETATGAIESSMTNRDACLPGCTTDHQAEGPLDERWCATGGVAVEVRNDEQIVVWAARIDGEAAVNVAHAPDGAVPAELSPEQARRFAAELLRAVQLVEAKAER